MTSDDQILVSRVDEYAFAKVLGRGSFKVSGSLKEFGTCVLENEKSELVLDLLDCIGMDSTFMGVVAGLSFRCKKQGTGKVVLVNLSEKTLKLISTLGLDHLVEYYMSDDLPGIYKQALEVGEAMDQIQPDGMSRDEQARMMLQSHETLAGISSENEERFKDVIAYLREEADGTA